MLELKKISFNPLIETIEIDAISNMKLNYQEIDGIKSSKEGFICKNMYIAKIEDNNETSIGILKIL